ncbi:MAG TPA: adenylate/guanylate cyclase domain-containing protein [Roseiarcus sp.]|jgi:class 3 adenylate cyclase/predicted ATPase
MDVGDWLKSVGLGQYEASFRDDGVDAEVLPDLTDADLEKLGVLLGHRKRLIKAIAGLNQSIAGSRPAAAAGPGTKPDAAERRQLTVMFCDLVGSTALAARLDPEDMRGIIGAYHRCCASLIESNGGFVAKYMGDGVLAYFGYPRAHEHDAERAVSAGLEIVEAAPKLETAAGSALHVRVGIATGVVVVGDLLGSGESQERGVVGDTPNLAARLQGIAEPDSVVIAEGTRKLLGDLFELADLGPHDLKGVGVPAHAWAALRPSAQESRFEALHAGELTVLVGREEESELLLRRWAKAKAGEGQVVLLSGEAGIGKSRLTAALLERLKGDPHTRMRYFCSPQHTDSALYPIVGHMARAAGLAREDDARAKLDKLDALLARSATSREDAALLAEMLSLPNDGRYSALELSPQLRRQKTMEALIGQIEAIARETPVLMIFEDAHWADPSSLEVFGRLVDKIAGLRVLLFVTFRPEFAAPWVGRPHVTALTINRLDPREVMALIDRVAGDKPLAPNIRQDILERADGIPLFVEEMTKAVLEAEGEGAATRTISAVPSPALAVPASLHASLMARLDRLGSAKAIAQIGAAIGREFSHALLATVSGEAQAKLTVSLDRLVQAGLLSRQGAPPDATYLFKHALVQDAAYGALLREPRRALHARIAEVFDREFPEIAESQPELLARHFSEAGLIEKAAHLWGKAGLRSLARSAIMEAEPQLSRALAQIATLPSTPALRREQSKLQVGFANALMHTKGYAASETKGAMEQARAFIERAEALGEPAEDPLALFSVLYGFWVANFADFKGNVMCDLAAQFLALAQARDGTAPLMIGHRILGTSLAVTGDLVDGRAHLDRAIALYDPQKHRALTSRFGQDVGVVSRSWRSVTLWLIGRPDAAKTDVEQALSDAREAGHAVTLLYALITTALTQICFGNPLAARGQCREAVVLADAKGALFWQTFGRAIHGIASLLTENAAISVSSTASAISSFGSIGATVTVGLLQSNLGLSCARLGQFDKARRCIGEATALAERTGERWFDPEISRVSGEIELLSPERDAAKAQAHFECALDIARGQQARSWELRAATSLARLMRDQGRRAKAYDLLAPIYGWFTEGFDTLDLKAARALLEELA